jgi:hypothetical protein
MFASRRWQPAAAELAFQPLSFRLLGPSDSANGRWFGPFAEGPLQQQRPELDPILRKMPLKCCSKATPGNNLA